VFLLSNGLLLSAWNPYRDNLLTILCTCLTLSHSQYLRIITACAIFVFQNWLAIAADIVVIYWCHLGTQWSCLQRSFESSFGAWCWWCVLAACSSVECRSSHITSSGCPLGQTLTVFMNWILITSVGLDVSYCQVVIEDALWILYFPLEYIDTLGLSHACRSNRTILYCIANIRSGDFFCGWAHFY
jgi:hypothetical protein